ncbi:MAG: TIGR04255 family protein [Acidobacteriota bacterium]
MKNYDSKYKRPVIVEAVFELRFNPLPNWEIGSFVKFAEIAKKKGFSVMRDSPQQFQVTFSPNHEPITNKSASHIQTWNKDETQLWQAGQSLYAANQREPYQGWEVFRPHILKGFKLYSEVVNPKEAEVLILRYINRISFNKSEEPNALLVFLPSGVDFSQNLLNFGCKAEYAFEDGERITVTCAKDISQQKESAVILDILYLKPNPNLETNNLEQTIEKIHNRILERFEESITNELRKRMGVV